MAIVSVQSAEAYRDDLLDSAIAAHFEALGVANDLQPGMKVLLKPNLLAGRDPATAVTTHPAVLAAVARWLRAHGIDHITLADSPGGVYTTALLKKTYTACGLDQLRPLMILNEDVSFGQRADFDLLTPVLEADYIINCAKLKTHGLTVMSAGVKNLFGCIPGLKKPEWHCRRPSLDGFANMLIDLCDAVKPDVTFIDAIDCMEGNGPGGGTVRHMGVTLCSRDPYALDEQAALLMGMTAKMPPIVAASRRRGKLDTGAILTGDALIPANPPFTLPDAILGKERFWTPNGLFHVFCGRGRVYPRVNTAKCVGCGKCAESCPMHLITIEDRKAVIRKKGCISCFCCQEMCPAHAIDAKR
ncbi:MAG: DUF362 domain-containing protein [Clostridia bacterium]|nr:DUF362 domain-containing protein [Clostridia bacterium]